MNQKVQNQDDDREILAMIACRKALSALNSEEQGRVMHWLIEKLDVTSASVSYRHLAKPAEEKSGREGTTSISQFQEVADLFATIQPSTHYEKVLVVAAHLQSVGGAEDFGSLEVNTRLKNLGHGVGNITEALSTLIGQRPSLVIQTRKSGASKQARKRYKVTVAGLNKVTEMLREPEPETSNHKP